MYTKETLSLLRKAERRIKKGWTQRTYARDKEGVTIRSDSKHAVQFCLLGSINEETRTNKDDTVIAAKEAIMHVQPAIVSDDGLHYWNDDPFRTQEQVLDTLHKAVNLVRRELHV